MEKEEKLEIFGDFLESEAKREDRDEPCYVEEKGENNHRDHMGECQLPDCLVRGPFLKS